MDRIATRRSGRWRPSKASERGVDEDDDEGEGEGEGEPPLIDRRNFYILNPPQRLYLFGKERAGERVRGRISYILLLINGIRWLVRRRRTRKK